MRSPCLQNRVSQMEPQTFLKGEKPHRPSLMSHCLVTNLCSIPHPSRALYLYVVVTFLLLWWDNDQEHCRIKHLFCLNIPQREFIWRGRHMAAGVDDHISWVQKVEPGFKPSKPSPICIFLHSMVLPLKVSYASQLGTGCAETWAYMVYCSFKPPHISLNVWHLS